MISVCFLMFLLFQIEKSSIQTYLLTLSLILTLIGYGLKLNGFYKIQQLQGKFTGSLIFQKEYIEINNQIININETKKIEIEGIDWYGFQTTNYLLTYNYENGLSNGIKNYLTLTLINNQKMKIQFQKNYPCEFSEIKDIIKHYYKNDKIYLSNCLQILCLDTKEKVDNFER